MIMIKFQNDKIIVFFGGIAHSLEQIQSEFMQENLHFKRIKQTHSDTVIEANLAEETQADAHYTDRTNEALLIATADCMPIMIYCEQTHRVAAVHAGWRGVENKIIEKTIKKLINTGSNQKKFKFWVGPHIQQESFEVEADVEKLLSKVHYGLKTEDFCSFKNKKYYINLQKILEAQIQNTLGSVPDIVYLDIDTKTNPDYYSYRRDSHTKKRNLSFICLLS